MKSKAAARPTVPSVVCSAHADEASGLVQVEEAVSGVGEELSLSDMGLSL